HVYCVESTAEGGGQDALAVDTAVEPAEDTTEGLGDAVTLTGSARGIRAGYGGWPYGARPEPPGDGAGPLTFVPYHLWGNRGPATMRVWVPEG
ncbi:MAG: glycoside hydrolase family 127 protein, partial [Actinomadura sp.]